MQTIVEKMAHRIIVLALFLAMLLGGCSNENSVGMFGLKLGDVLDVSDRDFKSQYRLSKLRVDKKSGDVIYSFQSERKFRCFAKGMITVGADSWCLKELRTFALTTRDNYGEAEECFNLFQEKYGGKWSKDAYYGTYSGIIGDRFKVYIACMGDGMSEKYAEDNFYERENADDFGMGPYRVYTISIKDMQTINDEKISNERIKTDISVA